MAKVSRRSNNFNGSWKSFAVLGAVFSLILIALSFDFGSRTSAQTILVSLSGFRVGEKLTYTLSFGKIPNAG